MTPCPSINELRDFNSGRIANPLDIDRISEHLGHCHRCIDELDRMGPDPLAAGLKESQDSQYTFDVDDFQDDDYSSAAFTQVMSKISSEFAGHIYPPETLGENRFQILGVVANGHYGSSFLACLDPEDLYRVKIPSADKIVSKQHYDQFCDDCKIAQSLEHPNIQTPIEFGRWDEKRFFYSATYLQPSLTHSAKKAFADNPIPCKDVITIFGKILDTINYAHSKNIWHRNLTPDNIWILTEDDEINISIGDFGFSLDSRYQFELLEKIQKPNTFMSPETINNDATYIDQRADIYSLGRILKVLSRICDAPPDGSNLEGLQKIIAKCTQPRRSERYQTIDELKLDWGSLTQGLY